MAEESSRAGQVVGVDFVIPLWGVISVLGGGFVLLVGMFFNISAMQVSMKELQTSLVTKNAEHSALASRLTLLEFRMQNNTEELRLLSSKQMEKVYK